MNIDRDLLEVFLLFIFLLFSAFFSASETAFMAVDRLWLEVQILSNRGKNRKAIKKIKDIVSRPAKLLSAILVGNNLVNVAVSSIGTALSIKWFGEEKGVLFATVVITILLLVFAEVTPKTIASYNPEAITKLFVYPINFFIKLFMPVSYVVNKISRFFMLVLGIKISEPGSSIERSHVKHLLRIWKDRGLLSEIEERMVSGLLSLKTLAVEHVMKPRDKVVYVEEGDSLDELLSVALNTHFSRLPVIDPKTGLVKGVVHVKDLLQYCRRKTDSFSIMEIIRKPVFVHSEKNLWELFLLLTKSRGEMTIVVNEYGDFLGIVTLEEILEEIVGEIYDEYDIVAVDEIREVAPGEYEVDGRITLHKLEENLEASFPMGSDRILSEYLLSISEGELQEGETLEDEEFLYKIVKMKGYHPELVRIIKKRNDNV